MCSMEKLLEAAHTGSDHSNDGGLLGTDFNIIIHTWLRFKVQGSKYTSTPFQGGHPLLCLG